MTTPATSMKLGLLLLAVAGPGCASVHAELVVPAPPAEVWAVLTDAEGYAAWNPVLVRAEGAHVEDGEVTYTVRELDGEEYRIEATVERVAPMRELNQRGGTWGILTFDHQWLLEPVPGGTRVVQHEEYRGVGVLFWDESWLGPAYARANEALRDRLRELRRERESEGPALQTP